MRTEHPSEQPRRRPVNLTIREDIIFSAKELGVNASKAAEEGIVDAVRKAKEQEWLVLNRGAIKAHNERVDREGVVLKPYWLDDQ